MTAMDLFDGGCVDRSSAVGSDAATTMCHHILVVMFGLGVGMGVIGDDWMVQSPVEGSVLRL